MGSVLAEFVKLKRSLSWAVVVLLPVMAVLLGAGGTVLVEQRFEQGWHTLWVRSVGFYGMALLPVGVAILASLVWRAEHANGNWNAPMGRPVSTFEVLLGKTAAVAVPTAAMQAVLVASVVLLGKAVIGLPGMLPAEYFATTLLIMAGCVPVAALQSGLSALLRSFAAPVAAALVGTGVSTALLMLAEVRAVLVLPYAVATQAALMGSGLDQDGTAFEVVRVTPASALALAAFSAVLTAVIMAGATAVLDRRDVRA